MTALPAASDFTGPISQGNFKTAITALRDYNAGITGTDGTVATALATLGTLAGTYVAKTAAYTVLTSDRGRSIDATTGTWTLSLPAVASAGSGFSLMLRNSGSGVITVDPSGAELIDGVSTLAVAPGRAVLLVCTGTAWISHFMVAAIGTSTDPGLVPASGGGTVNFLRSDFSWQPLPILYDASGNVSLGSATTIPGMGLGRINSQGTPAVSGFNLNIVRHSSANVIGPSVALGKTRSNAFNTYTIVTAGDQLGNLEFWGADGSGMIKGAYIQGYNIGTPAAGDVRGGLKFFTGSGVNATTNRLTIDDTTIAAALPITSTGPVSSGFAAIGTAAPGAIAFGAIPNRSITPNATGTFTASSVPPAGTNCTLEINTAGTTSFTLTFGSGFVAQGTLATGIVAGKRFMVTFHSNGTTLNELSRTIAM